MSETSKKQWWQSRTVWGGIIVIFAVIGQYLGYQITAEQQASIVESIMELIAAAGGMIAIFGRIAANEKIAPFRPQTKP